MRVEAKDLKKTENTGTSFIRNSSFLNIKIQPLSPLRIKQSSLRNFPLINIYISYILYSNTSCSTVTHFLIR